MGADPIFSRSIFHLSLLHENACVAGYTLNQEMSSSVIAGGAERDPGGAEWTAAESAGLRRRKAMSTSGWLGDRTRPMMVSARLLRSARNDNPLTLTLSLQGRGKLRHPDLDALADLRLYQRIRPPLVAEEL